MLRRSNNKSRVSYLKPVEPTPHGHEFVNTIAHERISHEIADIIRTEAVAVTEFEQRNQDIPDSQVRLEAAEVIADFQKQLDDINARTTEVGALCLIRLSLRFKNEQLDAKSTTSPLKVDDVLAAHLQMLSCKSPTSYIYPTLPVSIPTLIFLPVANVVVVISHDRKFADAIALHNNSRPMTKYKQDFWAERKGGIWMKGGVPLGMKLVAVEKKDCLGGEEGPNSDEGGCRAGFNRDNVGYHFTSREEIEIYKLDKPIILDIPSQELRFQGSLISASNITFSYSHSATKCLEDVSLMIHSEDRAGLVGKNWEGKPTLVKLFTVICEMVPMKGSIEQHPRLRLGHPLRRAKVRPALAIVVYPAPNLLDEKYTGTVLLVNHDRHFMCCVIEGEHAVPRPGDSDGESDEGSDEDDDTGQSGKGTFYAVGPKGRVKLLSGGMDDCAVVIEKQLRKLGLPQGGLILMFFTCSIPMTHASFL
ncbi:hypothetical protein BDQ17DRAFT_1437545 [Cyathus striatus]|nr:hypothetical protein BDQ17DRAFT_1437545 [Cyathus striatus]